MTQLREIAEILLGSGALRFGDFTTKAGRQSPYFINFGHICRGDWLRRIGSLYNAALDANGVASNATIFGPAYKGIILAIATAQAETSQRSFAFNRKEAKDHGEGGVIVGQPLQEGQDIVIVDDVLSRGTSAKESLELMRAQGVKVRALLVGVDREEAGYADSPARNEIEATYGIPVWSLTTVSELTAFLAKNNVLGKRWIGPAEVAAIDDYREATFMR